MTDARALTLALKGRWHGTYGLAFCPAHANTRTPALSLSDGAEGRLLATCFAGCSFAGVMVALRGLGLVEGGGACVAPDPAQSIKRQAEAQAMADKKAAQAKQVWAEALPINGTKGHKYARAGHHLRLARYLALSSRVLAPDRETPSRPGGAGRGRRRLCGAPDLSARRWQRQGSG